jgi:hypothetical protein
MPYDDYLLNMGTQSPNELVSRDYDAKVVDSNRAYEYELEF